MLVSLVCLYAYVNVTRFGYQTVIIHRMVMLLTKLTKTEQNAEFWTEK